MVSRWNSSGMFSQDSIRCSSATQSPRVPVKKMSVEPEDFTGRIIFMSMFNDISWKSEDNEQECNANDPYWAPAHRTTQNGILTKV